MTNKIAIHWFRQDLRLSDNPALRVAATHKHVLPIYILDDENSGMYGLGDASRWWLHHSLISLKKSLDGHLTLYRGSPERVFAEIITRFDVQQICWNRCYELWRIERDKNLKVQLETAGIKVSTCNGSLLWEPWTIKKQDDTPFKVFTPFFRKGCLSAQAPREPQPLPENVDYCSDPEGNDNVDFLKLLPEVRWGRKFEPYWKVGESGSQRRFKRFIKDGLPFYKDGRNNPAEPVVSRLSPHLHFGEISPHQLWHTVRNMGDHKHIDHFCSELGWREFSYHLLYHHPDLPTKNLQQKFNWFPWVENDAHLMAWQKGETGVPMVDAGMRELWQTGYMHNRVRMIVGSFLVKNLLLHWHHGERWFWNTLVDADLANNSASWQWIAGCGADAAPYFRIFNPVTQGQKFDPDGKYVRKYVPELIHMPNKFLFNPWEAPETVLDEAQVKLGETYPAPIVNLRKSRELALKAFHTLKQSD